MEQLLTALKKQALIEANADITRNDEALNQFLQYDDPHLSDEAKSIHKKALANYKVVNILRVIAITATIFALVHFTFNSQPNMALLLLAAFSAGYFYNIQRP